MDQIKPSAILLLFAVIGFWTDASAAQEIRELCDVGLSANFTWTVPGQQTQHIIVVTENRTKVMLLVDDGLVDVEADYSDRITDYHYQYGSLEFVLKNVSQRDAGKYMCYKSAVIGNPIPNCGQTLICIVFEGTHVNASQTAIEGGHVTLKCNVTSSSELPDNWDQTLHYSWFKDGVLLDKQTEREARLGPLTREDQGNYTCCPSVDVGRCVPLEKTEAFPLHFADDKSINLGLAIGLPLALLV